MMLVRMQLAPCLASLPFVQYNSKNHDAAVICINLLGRPLSPCRKMEEESKVYANNNKNDLSKVFNKIK